MSHDQQQPWNPQQPAQQPPQSSQQPTQQHSATSWEDTGWQPAVGGQASAPQSASHPQSANQWENTQWENTQWENTQGWGNQQAWPAQPGQQPPPGQQPQQPQQQWQPGPGQHVAPPRGESGGVMGFLRSLFDLSFDRFVSPSIIKVLYALAIALVVLNWVGTFMLLFIAGASAGSYSDDGTTMVVMGFLTLLLGWIPALFFIGLIRMGFEFMLALVRTSEDVHVLRERSDA
ncbi:DUF4282 domain-containing protein [Aestuariimicrobium soli]|uniref:DUF4282 domain-containing protein n=1 Tax=Aestuariimicrobium soli TaxID=2035834 RepID=UPI003EB83949